MFGETTISYVKIGNHPIETTIYKWLFGVPGFSRHGLFLVGGWTNPFAKIFASQIRSFSQAGVKIKNITVIILLKPPPRFQFVGFQNKLWWKRRACQPHGCYAQEVTTVPQARNVALAPRRLVWDVSCQCEIIWIQDNASRDSYYTGSIQKMSSVVFPPFLGPLFLCHLFQIEPYYLPIFTWQPCLYDYSTINPRPTMQSWNGERWISKMISPKLLQHSYWATKKTLLLSIILVG